MDDQEILNRVIEAKREFGVKCSKYAGALTVEAIMSALQENGLPVSARDVFIRGVPIEIDLLIPLHQDESRHRILYDPSEVKVVFEIKNTGAFGEVSVNAIRQNFSRIQQTNKNIFCFYVTLSERRNYKWAITTDTLGFDAFTLFWHNGSHNKMIFSSSGDWQKLLDKLRSLI